MPAPPATAPADPRQWSQKSRGSVAATFRKHYTDRAYRCRACGKDAMFTAAEQKIAYEVRKTHIDVQRVLCEACWRDSHVVEQKIAACEAQWAESKKALAQDVAFLSAWRALLVEHQRYGARANSAAKNMLQKFLDRMTADKFRITSRPTKIFPFDQSTNCYFFRKNPCGYRFVKNTDEL